jgi:hypothetical protein
VGDVLHRVDEPQRLIVALELVPEHVQFVWNETAQAQREAPSVAECVAGAGRDSAFA